NIFLQAFAFLGVSQEIKMDNGRAYLSQKIQEFFHLWGIKHIMGIPYSSTGQSITERAYRT
ncbi:POK25 protein, partial [Polioptila caerulea]|nr:POK25 protein [Polioptila caerulea]